MRAFFRVFHFHFLLIKGEACLFYCKGSDNHVLHRFFLEMFEGTRPKGLHHRVRGKCFGHHTTWIYVLVPMDIYSTKLSGSAIDLILWNSWKPFFETCHPSFGNDSYAFYSEKLHLNWNVWFGLIVFRCFYCFVFSICKVCFKLVSVSDPGCLRSELLFVDYTMFVFWDLVLQFSIFKFTQLCYSLF